jgi:iron complex outermembrane receptor protein
MQRWFLGVMIGVLALTVSNVWSLSGAYAQSKHEEVIVVPQEEEKLPASNDQTEEQKRQDKKSHGKDKVETLDKVVVTATKTARNPDDVPASITVITAKDLERQNIKTADEALAQVPGAFDRRGKGWADTLANVQLRGMPADNQKRTLLMLDGQNMASSYTNSVTWSSLAVEDIERIEVIRGPFSALWGGSAMGGVINVITKTPKKLELSAGGSYGRYDSYTYNLSAGHRLWDQLSLKVSYNHRETRGYPSNLVTTTSVRNTPLTAAQNRLVTPVAGYRYTFNNVGKPICVVGDTGDNSVQDSIVTTKLAWDPAPGHKISFSTNLYWQDYRYGVPHTYLYNPLNGDPITTAGTTAVNRPRRLIGPSFFGKYSYFTSLSNSSYLSSFGHEHTAIYNLASENKLTESTTLKLKGGLVNGCQNWYDDGGTNYSQSPGVTHTSPSKNYNFDAMVEQIIGRKQVLTAGFSYATGFASSTDWTINSWRDPDSKTDVVRNSQGKDRTLSMYLQDEINWHPKFSTIIGGRLDFWSTYEGKYADFASRPKIWQVNLPRREQTAFSPKVAFLYRPYEWMTWRASAGTAFRPPNIYELYRTWGASSGTIYASNPFLKPETSVAWEVGATIKPFAGNVISATFFDSYIDDMMYRVQSPTNPLVQDYKNAGRARIYGVELEITQKLFRWLDVYGNMTLVDPRILKNPDSPLSVGKILTQSPTQQFKFGVNVNYWKINANLSGLYVSKRYTRDDNADGINGTYGSYDPYFLVNTKVTYSPVKYADISFSVDNLLNRKWFSSYITPGRMCWVEAKFKY